MTNQNVLDDPTVKAAIENAAKFARIETSLGSFISQVQAQREEDKALHEQVLSELRRVNGSVARALTDAAEAKALAAEVNGLLETELRDVKTDISGLKKQEDRAEVTADVNRRWKEGIIGVVSLASGAGLLKALEQIL